MCISSMVLLLSKIFWFDTMESWSGRSVVYFVRLYTLVTLKDIVNQYQNSQGSGNHRYGWSSLKPTTHINIILIPIKCYCIAIFSSFASYDFITFPMIFLLNKLTILTETQQSTTSRRYHTNSLLLPNKNYYNLIIFKENMLHRAFEIDIKQYWLLS